MGRAYLHFGWVMARNRAYWLEDRVTAGIDYASERGLDLWWLYLHGYRGRADLDRGRWDDAAAAATLVRGNPRDAFLLSTLALVVLGLVRIAPRRSRGRASARRGSRACRLR